jgi:hypothetical protein
MIYRREGAMPPATLLALSLTLIEAVAYSKRPLSPPVRISPVRAEDIGVPNVLSVGIMVLRRLKRSIKKREVSR